MEVLKKLRKQKKLSQTDLAQIFNVAQNTVSQWENGERNPDHETLVKLAEFFGTTTDFLLGINQTDYPPNNHSPRDTRDLKKFLERSDIMFDGAPLTEEDKEKVRKALELAFWDAKQQNKRKKS